MTKTKTALVLAGGGVTGAVYELGVLRALEAALEGRTANDFDFYVGTSAGAIVGSLLANGIGTEALGQLLDDQHPALRGLRHGDVFSWNTRGLARWALGLPGGLARAGAASARQRSLAPLVLALSEAAPPGLYNGQALARYLCEVYLALGGSDRFDQLRRDLFLIATNLNTSQRAVFGRGYAAHASISQAVAASTALPLVYAPVEIGGEWYADGGLRGNASLDVAVEQGARLVVCVNPLTPAAGGAAKQAPWQAMRIAAHAGLHYHLKHLRRQHPEVDFLLIEPHADDADFLDVPLMDFGARQKVLALASAAARRQLDTHYAHTAAVLARHGWRLRPPPASVLAERPGSDRPGHTGEALRPVGATAWPRLARPGHTGGEARPAVLVTTEGGRQST